MVKTHISGCFSWLFDASSCYHEYFITKTSATIFLKLLINNSTRYSNYPLKNHIILTRDWFRPLSCTCIHTHTVYIFCTPIEKDCDILWVLNVLILLRFVFKPDGCTPPISLRSLITRGERGRGTLDFGQCAHHARTRNWSRGIFLTCKLRSCEHTKDTRRSGGFPEIIQLTHFRRRCGCTPLQWRLFDMWRFLCMFFSSLHTTNAGIISHAREVWVFLVNGHCNGRHL